jgi:16S rRNA (guanine966-N2)-methyltransferase
VRESLFNVLAARLDFTGLSVLDLYAGSGALGLEALSRGASRALFVESDARAAAVITDNVAALKLSGATIRRASVAVVLATSAAAPVDLVFADPPYELSNADIEAVLRDLTENSWVAAGSVMVVERPKAAAPLVWPAAWETLRERKYGDTRLELAECVSG